MKLFMFISLVLSLTIASAKKVDRSVQRFMLYQDSLCSAVNMIWPEYTRPAIFAAQIEKESYWNPRAELKTSREYGYGFGQFTRAFRENGTIRMDVQKEMRDKYPKYLANWTFENRFAVKYQLIAFVILNKRNYVALKAFPDEKERTAAMLSAYNGGLGSVLQDRKLCIKNTGNVAQCSKWFGGTELHSRKSRKPLGKEYSKSAFQINREYPVLIMNIVAPKYEKILKTCKNP